MPTDRSDALHAKWRESTEKFDYFMLGVCGALCAFVAQSYRPQRIGLNSGTLELLSLLILVFAAVVGFRRIESTNVATLLNQQKLHAYERRGVMMEVINRGPGLNAQTGQTYTPEFAHQEVMALVSRISSIQSQSHEIQSKAHKQYNLRNALILIGFLVLVFAKIASAYE